MGLNIADMCIVLDSGDSEALSDFYARLLGWKKLEHEEGAEWICVLEDKPDAKIALLFQEFEDYARPTWPNAPGQQQMMMHMDFGVDDVEQGVAFALSCGATLAGQRGEGWTVMIDPAGHPFCIVPKHGS